ncbi:MAG: helix-turn-helix transcriptional regulator [Sphingobacterium sp.]|jgi:AraC-like DNA-binding protein|nr:helix-turn-helix transcriptional regulator [Sphingobacterium sp.]
MKVSSQLDLASVFGSAISSLDPEPPPYIRMKHAETHLHSNEAGRAILQSFDGLLGYLNILDLQTTAAQHIPLTISRADLHIFYFLQGQSTLMIRDLHEQQTYTLAAARGRYFYLPAGNYEIQVQAGDLTLLNFYFRCSIFRDGNERPFRFLHPLIEAYRQESPLCCSSIDFRVGPRTISRLRYLCQQLKKADFDNDQFIYHELTELIKLSRDKIFEEYEQRLGSSEEALDIYREMQRLIQLKGQEFRIEELCDIFSKTKQYLGRIFKKKFKQSLQDTRKQLLIERIKEQIVLQQSITETAYTCGFNNLYHFSTFFKNELGMSPSEYLKSQEEAD